MSNTGEHLKPVDFVLDCSKLVIVCVLENTEFLQLFLRAKTCKSEGQVVFQSRGVPDTYEKGWDRRNGIPVLGEHTS